MKLPIDPSHLDMPISLATCVIGATLSALGVIGATVAEWTERFVTWINTRLPMATICVNLTLNATGIAAL